MGYTWSGRGEQELFLQAGEEVERGWGRRRLRKVGTDRLLESRLGWV